MKWRDKINKKYLQISLYVIITAVIIYTILLFIKNIPVVAVGILTCVNWIIKVVKPVIIGFAFAYIMEPMVDFFECRYRKLKEKKLFRKMITPRPWAVFTSVFVLVIIAAGLISLLIFTVTDQIRLANLNDIANLINYYYENLIAFYQWVTDRLKDMDIQSQEFSEYIKNATVYIGNSLKGFINGTFSSITNISGYMTTFIFSIIIGIYFMIDGKMFIAYLKKMFKALFSENTNKKLSGMVHDLDVVFSGYIRGQLADALVMMLLISIVLSVTGVKFAIIIGVFAGLCNLIPYFGPIVAYVSTTLVCLISGDIRTWIISMIALLVIQAVDGNLIGPKLLSKSIQIHPLIVMVSLIFGSALGGLLGMLFAVPIGAYIKLIFVRFIDRQLEHREAGRKQ